MRKPTKHRLVRARSSPATGDRHELVEAARAHVVQNKVEAAYARSDLLERRWLLMDDWAAYLGGHAGAAARR